MAVSHVLTEETDSCFVMHLNGEVDVYCGPDLKKQIDEVLEREGTTRLVFDLKDTDYLDSTTLGIMIGTCKRMQEANGNLAINCPSERIRRVFWITGLDRIFDIYDNLNDAANAVSS